MLLEKVARVNNQIHYDKQIPSWRCSRTTARHLFLCPQPGLQSVAVVAGISTRTIEVYSTSDDLIAVHPRAFDKPRTRSGDPAMMLSVIARNPGSWSQCSLRSTVSTLLRDSHGQYDKARPKGSSACCGRSICCAAYGSKFLLRTAVIENLQSHSNSRHNKRGPPWGLN